MSLAEGNREWNLGAFWLFAKMAIANGGKSDGVVVDAGDESFELLHHADSPRVHAGSRAVTGWVCGFGWLSGFVWL
jgi:hypothetical protein